MEPFLKSIVTAAGNGIQMEVSQKCPNGLQTGQHVISSGGNLSCSEIFHAVLCNWDNGQGSAQKVNTYSRQFCLHSGKSNRKQYYRKSKKRHFYHPQTKLREGNVFRGFCHVHGGVVFVLKGWTSFAGEGVPSLAGGGFHEGVP